MGYSLSPGAIVVLGARVDASGQPSLTLRSRVAHATRLFAQGAAPLLVLSGGSASGFPTEAFVAATLAIEAGVPKACCLLEERSRSTRENARFCAELLLAQAIHHVWLVTDPYHMPRAQMLFRRAGLSVTPQPAPRALAASTALSRLGWAIRELPALAKDWVLTARRSPPSRL